MTARSEPTPKAAHLQPPEVAHVAATEGGWRIEGVLSLRSVSAALPALARIEGADVTLDLSGLKRLDTAGAYALYQTEVRIAQAGGHVRYQGLGPDHAALMERVAAAVPTKPDDAHAAKSLTDRLEDLGRMVAGAGAFVAQLCAMLGMFIARLVRMIRHPYEFRMTALVHHADEVGLRAVPIVMLMSFLIGVVLAFQGAVQLRQFGAEIFVVDLIAISILRELGILLTAIIVAGRTASSFTAAIGSMKMREEIDAMRTLAIDPVTVLFVPRILALLITLPILGMVANLLGLFGGMMMAWIELGISPGVFLARLLEGTSLDHVLVGFSKAPVFAIIIGVIGCHAGMQVGGNAESLGRQTSASVVRAIFAVILANALFSVFFALMGI